MALTAAEKTARNKTIHEEILKERDERIHSLHDAERWRRTNEMHRQVRGAAFNPRIFEAREARCSNCSREVGLGDIHRVFRFYLCQPCWFRITSNFAECFPDYATITNAGADYGLALEPRDQEKPFAADDRQSLSLEPA